jgi:hypothetical protein
MNYEEFSQKSRSEKVTLVTVEAVHQVKLFTLHSGAVYYRDVDHFVVNVRVNGETLVEADNASLGAGAYYFDATAKRLYLRTLDDSDPKENQIAITYKFFFANAPYHLPHDLDEGEVVEFEARVSSVGALGQSLDDQNTGIVLESSSSVALENTDGFWDEVFDTLIWENQAIRFYSWSPSIPISEATKIFDGLIESKDFSLTQVIFKVKDFVFKLKNKVNLPLFSEDDGNLSPSDLGTPKRRIYGQVKQLKCVGIDKVLDGFALTGTISIELEGQTVTGSGTQFLSELSPGDELIIELPRETFKFAVETVDSDTSLTVGSRASSAFVGESATVRPKIPYRSKNRRWLIAGHKLRAPSATIESVDSNNRISVDTSEDFFADDSVKINDEYVTIRRITGGQFVLNSALIPAPDVGDTVTKNPVSKAFFKNKELFIDRDWTLTNDTEAILELDELAEFNIAEQRALGFNLTFTNGSRTITTATTLDLRTILNPRDWIRKNSVTETTWYEILDVREQTVTIRTAFTGATETTSGLYKNVDLIDDDSLITVNCMGMEFAGQWIKTPSDAVKHLIEYDAGFTELNDESFEKAKAECGFILSLPIPLNVGDKAPQVKEVITLINESCFGSLYGDSSWDISYSILNSKKPEEVDALSDDDIISFDVVSDQKIINEIKINYRPFTDYFTGEEAFETYSHESEFVNRFVGIRNAEEKTIYLYEEDKAKIIAQRMLFFRSLSTCKVQVKGKLNLATKSVNDKLFLNLNRLYKRYGGGDRRKIGNIVSIKKNGPDVDVDFIDLGNIYNRVPSIAPNDADIYADAEDSEIAKWGYVLDNDTLTPDVSSEFELGNNLIG